MSFWDEKPQQILPFYELTGVQVKVICVDNLFDSVANPDSRIILFDNCQKLLAIIKILSTPIKFHS